MSLDLTHPVYLFGLLALGWVALVYWRSLADISTGQKRILFFVRSLIIVLLVLAISGLSLRTPTHEIETVFLIDKSLSVNTRAGEFTKEYLEKAKNVHDSKSDAKPLKIIEFASSPRLSRQTEKEEESTEWSLETDISAAVKPAIAMVSPDRLPHLVLITDGNETRGDIISTVLQSGVPVSTIPLPGTEEPEVQLAEIRIPSQLSQGESFPIDLVVRSNRKTEGLIAVFRRDFKVIEERKPLEIGENVFRYIQVAGDRKQEEFSAIVHASEDTILENNAASTVAYIGGKPRMLLIESDPDLVFDFVAALGEQGIEVETRPIDGLPQTLEELESFEALILSNVPATAFTLNQMNLVRNYVRDLGGGLIMLGGEQSFGLGGYSESPLNEVLPVNCEFEKEKEKPSLAISLVIDRSGSMEGEKIELAKDAAKSVVELLTARDFISVIAFDGAPHLITRIQNVVTPSTIRSEIGRIEAEGGTNIYPAILEAFDQLDRVSAKLKHVILLSDGQSQPGDFEEIARKMVDARITLSTIGVGDSDNELLQRLADIGQGRFYTCDDPQAIPQIFAKETITASQSAIKEIPFSPVQIVSSEILTGIQIETAPPLLGFITTRTKPTSQVILATESGEPLLAVWRYGLGISVAFTSDVKERWAAEWMSWPEFGRFWSQIARHTIRQPERGLVVDLQEKDGVIKLSLDALDDSDHFLNQADGVLTVIAPDLSKSEIPLEPTAPGRYEASIEMSKRGAYHLQTLLKTTGGEKTLSAPSRGVNIPYPNELRLKPTDTEKLETIARLSKGSFNPTPEELFQPDLTRTAWKITPLWPWLIGLVFFLFLLDLLLRRIDFNNVKYLE